jgi:hypothetical protein
MSGSVVWKIKLLYHKQDQTTEIRRFGLQEGASLVSE